MCKQSVKNFYLLVLILLFNSLTYAAANPDFSAGEGPCQTYADCKKGLACVPAESHISNQNTCVGQVYDLKLGADCSDPTVGCDYTNGFICAAGVKKCHKKGTPVPKDLSAGEGSCSGYHDCKKGLACVPAESHISNQNTCVGQVYDLKLGADCSDPTVGCDYTNGFICAAGVKKCHKKGTPVPKDFSAGEGPCSGYHDCKKGLACVPAESHISNQNTCVGQVYDLKLGADCSDPTVGCDYTNGFICDPDRKICHKKGTPPPTKDLGAGEGPCSGYRDCKKGLACVPAESHISNQNTCVGQVYDLKLGADCSDPTVGCDYTNGFICDPDRKICHKKGTPVPKDLSAGEGPCSGYHDCKKGLACVPAESHISNQNTCVGQVYDLKLGADCSDPTVGCDYTNGFICAAGVKKCHKKGTPVPKDLSAGEGPCSGYHDCKKGLACVPAESHISNQNTCVGQVYDLKLGADCSDPTVGCDYTNGFICAAGVKKCHKKGTPVPKDFSAGEGPCSGYHDCKKGLACVPAESHISNQNTCVGQVYDLKLGADCSDPTVGCDYTNGFICAAGVKKCHKKGTSVPKDFSAGEGPCSGYHDCKKGLACVPAESHISNQNTCVGQVYDLKLGADCSDPTVGCDYTNGFICDPDRKICHNKGTPSPTKDLGAGEGPCSGYRDCKKGLACVPAESHISNQNTCVGQVYDLKLGADCSDPTVGCDYTNGFICDPDRKICHKKGTPVPKDLSAGEGPCSGYHDCKKGLACVPAESHISNQNRCVGQVYDLKLGADCSDPTVGCDYTNGFICAAGVKKCHKKGTPVPKDFSAGEGPCSGYHDCKKGLACVPAESHISNQNTCVGQVYDLKLGADCSDPTVGCDYTNGFICAAGVKKCHKKGTPVPKDFSAGEGPCSGYHDCKKGLACVPAESHISNQNTCVGQVYDLKLGADCSDPTVGCDYTNGFICAAGVKKCHKKGTPVPKDFSAGEGPCSGYHDCKKGLACVPAESHISNQNTCVGQVYDLKLGADCSDPTVGCDYTNGFICAEGVKKCHKKGTPVPKDFSAGEGPCSGYHDCKKGLACVPAESHISNQNTCVGQVYDLKLGADCSDPTVGCDYTNGFICAAGVKKCHKKGTPVPKDFSAGEGPCSGYHDCKKGLACVPAESHISNQNTCVGQVYDLKLGADCSDPTVGCDYTNGFICAAGVKKCHKKGTPVPKDFSAGEGPCSGYHDCKKGLACVPAESHISNQNTCVGQVYDLKLGADCSDPTVGCDYTNGFICNPRIKKCHKKNKPPRRPRRTGGRQRGD